MFSEYKKEIIKTYEKKKIKGGLSINLQQPTPAKLRDEWLLVIQDNYTPQKDDALLRTFFGPKGSINEYFSCIKKLDPDKFKPLLNFLKGITKDTDDKNVELLAWLIDYKDRPFRFHLKHKVGKEIKEEGIKDANELSKEIKLDDLADLDQSSENKDVIQIISNQLKNQNRNFLQTNRRLKYTMILLAIVSICLIFGNDMKRSFHKNECMYWNEIKYVAVSCDVKLLNKNIIALDTFNLKYFQKITDIDTLTAYSAGKIWYLKMDNHVEFFTSNGYHPVHIEKQLKSVTQYIIEKYAWRKDSVLKTQE